MRRRRLYLKRFKSPWLGLAPRAPLPRMQNTVTGATGILALNYVKWRDSDWRRRRLCKEHRELVEGKKTEEQKTLEDSTETDSTSSTHGLLQHRREHDTWQSVGLRAMTAIPGGKFCCFMRNHGRYAGRTLLVSYGDKHLLQVVWQFKVVPKVRFWVMFEFTCNSFKYLFRFSFGFLT